VSWVSLRFFINFFPAQSSQSRLSFSYFLPLVGTDNQMEDEETDSSLPDLLDKA